VSISVESNDVSVRPIGRPKIEVLFEGGISNFKRESSLTLVTSMFAF